MQQDVGTLEVSKLAPSEHLDKLLELWRKDRSELLQSHIRKVAAGWERKAQFEQSMNVALPA